MPNFSFNTSIPASNNNPSLDQPEMLTNNQSTDGILAVDHVTFNANDGGTHLQVSFSSNNTPSLPTNFPTLFTGTLGGTTGSGLSELFFYSGNAAQSSNQYKISANGSVMLFGGIILKWATVTGNLVSTTFASLGLNDFPNNVFAASATPKSGSGVVSITALSTSAITVGAGSSAQCYVFILGN